MHITPLALRTRAILSFVGLVFCLGIAAQSAPAEACTAFGLRRGDAVIVGKSYDWHSAAGLLMVNKRGVAKQAMLMQRGLKAARWVSRFGSLTFNQYGRELPLGGINEQGLVMEVLWLSSARYGDDTSRPALNELQLIQYLLDTTATTAKAVEAAGKVRVARGYARVHYLVCDRAGACATLEHLDGKLVAHQGNKLPVALLTNSTYAQSRSTLRGYRGFGGKRAAPGDRGSLSRFVRAATGLQAIGKKAAGAKLVDAGFAVLESVHTPNFSRWQTIYQPKLGQLSFRLAGKKARLIAKTQSFDFRCKSPVRVLDLTGAITGKAGQWMPYSRALNEKLLRYNLGRTRVRLPAPAVEQLIVYPERLPCVR